MAWIIGSVTDAEYDTLREQGWCFGKPKDFKLPDRSDAGERVAAIHVEAGAAKIMELVANL